MIKIGTYLKKFLKRLSKKNERKKRNYKKI